MQRQGISPLSDAFEVPRVSSLFELSSFCESPEDGEFWQCVTIGAARDLCGPQTVYPGELPIRAAFRALQSRRYDDWNGPFNFPNAEAAICGEINLYLDRLFNEGAEMVVATKTKPTKQKIADKSADRAAQLKAAGKSRPKPDPTAEASASELLASVEIIEERDVEYSAIVRSKQNPRQTFDETLIAEMRPNIVTICQMSPLTIREGTNELIDGETRHRAAEGVAKYLRCKIVRCTDEQAACIRLQTSMQRRDLNPIEKAVALQAMLDGYGLTQRQLAPIVKMEQGSINNLTRLLKLPEEWRKMVISGEITGTAARDLVPWAEERGVLAGAEKQLRSVKKEDRSLALPEILEDAILSESRPLKGYHWTGTRQLQADLSPTDEQRDKLRVRKIKLRFSDEERAFNIDYWYQLVEEAEELRIAKMERREANLQKSVASGKVDPKKAAENAKRQEEILQKRLYRYKTGWLQTQLITCVDGFSFPTLMKYALFFARRHGSMDRSNEFLAIAHGQDRLRADSDYGGKSDLRAMLNWNEVQTWSAAAKLLTAWLAEPFDISSPAITPEMFEILAEDAGVDLKLDWPASCKRDGSTYLIDYLELLSKDQLIDLVAEWKLSVPVINKKRAELITGIEQVAAGKPVPKALASVKPCSLC